MNKKAFLLVVSIVCGSYNFIESAQQAENLAGQMIRLYDAHPNNPANELKSFLEKRHITDKEAISILQERKYDIQSISDKKVDMAEDWQMSAAKAAFLGLVPLYLTQNRVWQTPKALNLDKIYEIYPQQPAITTLQQLFKTYSPLEKFFLFSGVISLSSSIIGLGLMAYMIYESIEKNEVRKIDAIISIIKGIE